LGECSPLNGSNVSYKDKIQKLVGHIPNKKDISKIIQENRQKKGVNSLFNLNGFANLLSGHNFLVSSDRSMIFGL
jgi:hypothetical protein